MAELKIGSDTINSQVSTMPKLDMNADIVKLDLPANHKYLNILGVCITALVERVEGLDDPQITAYNLDLAVHEACTNIVRHAYANEADGRIEVTLTLERHPSKLILDLYDTGQSFDPEKSKKPSLDKPQVHGYGLFLMEELLDNVIYNSHSGRNHWRLVKHLA
ncbi:MAG: ATP-binding protein [Chloroflexota bacterium]